MAMQRYRAQKGVEISHAVAAAPGYTIDVVFLGGLTNNQMAAFKLAAKRWTTAIVGDLPNVTIDGQTINNLRITAQGSEIDGPGQILGQAGPSSCVRVMPGPPRFFRQQAKCNSTVPTSPTWKPMAP